MQPSKKQNTLFLALVALVSLSGGLIGAEEPSSGIPLTLPAPQSSQLKEAAEYPAWVSARAIRSENGSLTNWDLIPPHYQRSYATAHRKRLLRIEEAQSARDLEKIEELARCPKTPTKYFRSNHGRRNHNLTDLTLFSQGIYRGRVRARDGGFVQGREGSLLLLEVDHVIKAPDNRPAPAQLFFEYPYADFQIGDMLFCLRPDRTPPVPEMGDSVIVFVLYPPTDQNLVLNSRNEEILFENAKGILSLPSTIRNDWLNKEFKTLSDIEGQIGRILATSKHQNGGVR